MDQAFLPADIIFNILTRLPAKTVIRCKCVCKSWLEQIETPLFVKDHQSKSIPGLIVCCKSYDSFKLFEYVDELELEHHSLHYNLVVEFGKTTFASTSPHYYIGFEGSVNGLLFLRSSCPTDLYVCNPITREYIELPSLEPDEDGNSVTYGFGVSETSGLYKVIRIRQEGEPYENSEFWRVTKSECWVYTLGRGEWKSIMQCPFYEYRIRNVFFNGNLHWLAVHNNDDFLISCFDLETEVFSTFAPPTLERPSTVSEPVVLEKCLCICENIESDNEVVIWLMKEYGNDNSWTKEFVLKIDYDLARDPGYHYTFPLKVFKDGDILLHWSYTLFLYYSKKTDTAQKLDLFEAHQTSLLDAWPHVSTFLSLGSLAMETVTKF